MYAKYLKLGWTNGERLPWPQSTSCIDLGEKMI